ncbi:unnamed protein product [Brassica oleracea]
MIRFVNPQTRHFAFSSINGNAKLETGIVSLLSRDSGCEDRKVSQRSGQRNSKTGLFGGR